MTHTTLRNKHIPQLCSISDPRMYFFWGAIGFCTHLSANGKDENSYILIYRNYYYYCSPRVLPTQPCSRISHTSIYHSKDENSYLNLQKLRQGVPQPLQTHPNTTRSVTLSKYWPIVGTKSIQGRTRQICAPMILRQVSTMILALRMEGGVLRKSTPQRAHVLQPS